MLAKVNAFDERLDFDVRTSSAVRECERVIERPRSAFERDHSTFGRTSSNVPLDNYVTYGRSRENIEAHCRNTASRKSRKKKPYNGVELIVTNTFECVTERANAF